MVALSQPTTAADVALLAEGVDRNNVDKVTGLRVIQSPSSRRAWIEISHFSPLRGYFVALLAEGVERNTDICEDTKGRASPSSRRAWIEI